MLLQMSGEISLLNQYMPAFKPSLRQTLSQNYDPTAYPPDLQFAQKHGLSKKVGKNISPLEDVQRCRCCLEAIHKEQLPITCDLNQLSHCGQSTPLYFMFIKQVVVLLLLNCCIITIPSMLINFVMGQQCKITNDGIKNLLNSVCRGSVINIMNIEEIDAMQIEAIIFFVAILINIVFIAYLQEQMKGYIKQFNKGKLRASDYSFLIKGLPSDISVPQIQKYVQDKLMFSGAPDTTIIKIYTIYNLKQYMLLIQKRQEYIQKKIEFQSALLKLQEKNLKSTNYEVKLQLQKQKTLKKQQIRINLQTLAIIQHQINKFQEILNQLTLKLKNQGFLEQEGLNKDKVNFSGKCIVTLNNKRSRQAVVEYNRPNNCFHFIAYRISELLEGSKSKIIITAAPQPSDIMFENMGSKKIKIWKNRILYSLLLIFLIFLDFLIVALAKKLIKQQKAIQQGNIIFSLCNSILVAIFCSVFRRIVKLSQKESYYTTTSKLYYSQLNKMVFILQINMFFTTFIANVASFYFIKEDIPTFAAFPLNFQSFLFDVFFIITTNPIITVIINFLDHRHIRMLIKKYRITHNSLAVSQAQANTSFQNMGFDVSYKYGTLFRFLLFSGGIAIIYPFSFVICLIVIILLYWQDKYLLVKRYSIVLKVNSRYTQLSQGLLRQFPIYISITNLLVMFIPIQDGTAFKEQKYSKIYYYLSVIALILSFLNYFIGNGWLRGIISSFIQKANDEDESNPIYYKDIQNELILDYSQDYPYFRVTKKIGYQNDVEGIRKDKLKQLRQNERLGVFQVLQDYINHSRYS